MEPLISVDDDDIPRIDSGLHLSMTGHPTLRRGTELPGLRTPQLCLLSLALCYLRHQRAVFALAKWNLGFRFPTSSPASLVDQHRPHESGHRDPGCLQWKCEIVNLDPITYKNPWMIGKCCFRVKECRPLKWNVKNFLRHFFMTHWPIVWSKNRFLSQIVPPL